MVTSGWVEYIEMNTKDLKQELEEVKGLIRDVSYQVQELRQTITGTPIPDEELPMPESYEHPWYKHIREGSLDGRDS